MKKIYMIVLLSLSVTLANATVHQVQVLSGSFSPSTVNAVCGDTVGWILISGTHTTTSTSVPSCATSWNAPINSTTPVYAIVVPCAGTYNYECSFHLFTGVINVTCTSGIEEANANPASVFPNPSADGIYNVSFGAGMNAPTEIFVLDMVGKTMMSDTVSSFAAN